MSTRNYPAKLHPSIPGIPVSKKGPCPVCGKLASRKGRIPTLTPDRTRRPYADIKTEEEAWLDAPVVHVGCEVAA